MSARAAARAALSRRERLREPVLPPRVRGRDGAQAARAVKDVVRAARRLPQLRPPPFRQRARRPTLLVHADALARAATLAAAASPQPLRMGLLRAPTRCPRLAPSSCPATPRPPVAVPIERSPELA